MRYIESLHIQNFQSYKNETISFDPGLNLLLGSSDSGKSAILRAISFVFYNHPKANTIIHNGEKEAKVTVKFNDGTTVTRIRGDRNAYFAQDKSGKKYSFDKIDKQIPDEIKKLLNYPPQDDFNGFISYADQFSQMFLVDLSPSDLPRSLSNLTGIELLEDCAKQLMQNYKQLDKQIKIQEKEYLELLNEYHSYDCVDDCQKQMVYVNKNLEEYNNLNRQFEDLTYFDIEDNFDQSNLDKINQIVYDVEHILMDLSEVELLITKLSDLELFGLLTINYNLNDLSIIDSMIKQISFIEKNFENYKKELNLFDALSFINNNYSEIKVKGQTYSAELNSAKNKLVEAEQDLSEYKKLLIEKNIICEVCGGILS